MDNIVEIWEILANKFNNERLADEILSFPVEMRCNFNNFENIASYPFIISFPGLIVCLNANWKTQLKNCFSTKFICNLDVSWIGVDYEGINVIANGLKTNSTVRKINLEGNRIGNVGSIVLLEIFYLHQLFLIY